jgi:hypothetical protein
MCVANGDVDNMVDAAVLCVRGVLWYISKKNKNIVVHFFKSFITNKLNFV